MLSYLAAHWYLLTLRGVFAILFGVVAIALPAPTVYALVILFGAYALVDGVVAIVAGIAGRGIAAPRWALLLEGFIGVAAGIATFTWPGLTAVILLYLIAAWAIVTGIFEILAAIQLRNEVKGEWILALAGVLSIVFGVFLMARPAAGALAIISVIGIYAIVFGVMVIALSLRLRSWHGRTAGTGSPQHS